MAISKLPLGLNARNFIFIRKFNRLGAKKVADDKIETKKVLVKNNISTTELISVFSDRSSIFNFDWSSLAGKKFAIKPARGYGGEGILVFKKWNGEKGKTVNGKVFTISDVESHIFDILDGAYSLQYLPDTAYIERAIISSPLFKSISPLGLPDIRVIVFNKVPIMAMIRIPTEESEGKANIHLGAIAVGIDMRTGITYHAIYKGKPTETLPGRDSKILGIKIPEWDKILHLAAKAQDLSGLGYAGIDIVLDKEKGPLVLEINARPGLSIQLANNDSLRTRLERLENIEVDSVDRGVELARSLFAHKKFSSSEDKYNVLNVIEEVTINNGNHLETVFAKLDTGAYRSSLDETLAEYLGLKFLGDKYRIRSASGRQIRKAVRLKFTIGGRSVSTIATVTDRSHLKYPLIVGRKDLKGFLINPVIQKSKPEEIVDELFEQNNISSKDTDFRSYYLGDTL